MRSNFIPRGVLSPVRAAANQPPTDIVATLTAGFETFKAHHSAQLGDMQAALDDLHKRVAAMGVNGAIIIGSEPAPDPDYSRTFASYARKGHGEQELSAANSTGERARIQAAMSAGDNQNGGYLAPVEWDRKISKALLLASPMRSLCTVISTSGPGYSTLWSDGQWGTGWVGETANRPQTSTPTLKPVTFRPGEIYAQPGITQQLLDDSAINLEDWLASEVSDTFARQEDIAFIAGDGVNKPVGFLSYIGTGTNIHPGGPPDVAVSGSASVITSDALIDLVYGLPAAYRPNSAWLMSSTTIAAVSKLKDGQGNYLWRESFIVGQPPTLLGRPVYLNENMPTVGANNYPIAFGDWSRFYVINDRLGTRVLRDPYTAKPYVLFYTTKRVGGGILDPKAVRILKVAAS